MVHGLCYADQLRHYLIPLKTLTDRVRHMVRSVFDGRRAVIYSGGLREEDDAVFADARAIRDGGGFCSIIGRNSLPRRKSDAPRFLRAILRIYAGDGDEQGLA
jgi:class I fructose-bisphosphate aldolase